MFTAKNNTHRIFNPKHQLCCQLRVENPKTNKNPSDENNVFNQYIYIPQKRFRTSGGRRNRGDNRVLCRWKNTNELGEESETMRLYLQSQNKTNSQSTLGERESKRERGSLRMGVRGTEPEWSIYSCKSDTNGRDQ